MSVLENLLIVHRREYAERRRYLADLETLAERLRADARRLRADVERTGDIAMPAAARGAAQRADADDAASSRLPIERYRKLAGSIADIDGQIAAAREALAAAERQLQRDERVRPAGRPAPRSPIGGRWGRAGPGRGLPRP